MNDDGDAGKQATARLRKILRNAMSRDWNLACSCVTHEHTGMRSQNTGIDAGRDVELQSKQLASEAFGQILSSTLQPLYRGAYRLLGNAADAEDAVQDALLAAYTHLDQFRGQAKISTWLTAIVHNSARMQLRKRLRHVHVPLDEPIGEVGNLSVALRLADRRPGPEHECGNTELCGRLSHFYSHLKPALRAAFQLRHIEGLSIRETARILGVPQGTVKAHTARARKKLSQLMRGALGSQNPNLADSTVRYTLAR